MLPGKKYKPEDVAEIAWRRKWLIVAPWVLVAVGTIAVARQLPNLYQAGTLIQIVPKQLSESYVKSTLTNRVEDRLQSLRNQILNRTRLEKLIDDFKLYPEQRRTWIMEDLIERMRKDVSITVVNGDTFRVSYI